MKTTVKFIILLLACGIVIPLYQYTGAVCTAPVITPVKAAKQQVPAKGKNLTKTSIMDDVAAKLLPVLKYF